MGLNNIVILDPQWLANIMATLISFKSNFVKFGVLETNSLSHLWKAYRPDLHPSLLKLLVSFSVAFPVHGKVIFPSEGEQSCIRFLPDPGSRATGNTNQYLVPSLLPENRPSVDLQRVWPSALPPGTYQMGRLLVFDFCIDFGKLFVRLIHSGSVNWTHAWKTGVILETSSKLQRAFIEWSPLDFKLSIFVRMSLDYFEETSDLFLFHEITQTLETLIEGYFFGDNKIQRLVPCK